MTPRGQLFFEFEGDSKILHVHVYEAEDWAGDPAETEEVRVCVCLWGRVRMHF